MFSEIKATATFGILFAFVLTIFYFPKFVEAAKVPEIIWAEDLNLVSDESNPLLKTFGDEELKGYKKKITDALTRKLHSARDEGKLPFTLKESVESYDQVGIYDDISEEVPVALIPLGVIADSLDAKYQVKDKTYHKSVVVGSLYLAICKGGSTANNWTMVGGVPISGYVILGDDINNLLTSEPTKKQKADAYVAAMEKVINGINFNDFKKHLQNLNSKKIPDTYEVMDVGLSSKKSAEIFGNQQEKIKTMLGAFYTAKFQETSKAVVYPPIAMIGSKKSGADTVSDSIYSLTGGKATSGATITISMPEPQHKIYLDFAGAAWQELKTKKESSVVKNIGYKALLKMHVDNQAEKSADAVKAVQYIIPESGSIDQLQKEQLPDIFTELLIRLADNLATGKK